MADSLETVVGSSSATEAQPPAPPPWPFSHPSYPLEDDEVMPGRDKTAGLLVAIDHDWGTILLDGPDYVRAGSLYRAFVWGFTLYGNRTFAVLEGPLMTAQPDYRVIPCAGKTSYELLTTRVRIGRREYQLFPARYWEPVIEYAPKDGDGWLLEEPLTYILRAVVDANDTKLFPAIPRIVLEYESEFAVSTLMAETHLAEFRARRSDEIHRRLAFDRPDGLKERLVAFDVNAFELLTADEKTTAFHALFEGKTNEPEELAIVELFRALKDQAEFETVVKALVDANDFQAVFDDMPSKRWWPILQHVGETFGGDSTLDDDKLLGELASLTVKWMPETAKQIAILVPPYTLLAVPNAGQELYDAASAIDGAIASFAEFIGEILTDPEKVLKGIGEALRVAVMLHLATTMPPDPEAVLFMADLMKQISRKAIFIMRGVEVLENLPGIAGRIKAKENILMAARWAIVIEIASWFIGVGEIKAALQAFRGVKEVSEASRVLRLLAEAGSVAEGTRNLARAEGLLRLMAKSATGEEELRPGASRLGQRSA